MDPSPLAIFFLSSSDEKRPRNEPNSPPALLELLLRDSRLLAVFSESFFEEEEEEEEEEEDDEGGLPGGISAGVKAFCGAKPNSFIACAPLISWDAPVPDDGAPGPAPGLALSVAAAPVVPSSALFNISSIIESAELNKFENRLALLLCRESTAG